MQHEDLLQLDCSEVVGGNSEGVFFIFRLFTKHSQLSRISTLVVLLPDITVMVFLYPLSKLIRALETVLIRQIGTTLRPKFKNQMMLQVETLSFEIFLK